MADKKPHRGAQTNQLIMDLGLFVPEQFFMTFKCGDAEDVREYRFEWSEANVEEMLQIMYEQQMAELEARREAENKAMTAGVDARTLYKPLTETMMLRQQLYGFLSQHLVEGPLEYLNQDMEQIPLTSLRGGLDLQTINDFVQRRIKKNDVELGYEYGWTSTGRRVLQSKDSVPYEVIRRSFEPRFYHAFAVAVVRTILRRRRVDVARRER